MKLFTTSLNYADLLEVTLPAWVQLGDVTVITSWADRATQDVTQKCGARVAMTDMWFAEGAKCNKGAAMQAIIPSLVMPGESIAVFDADCYPVGTPPVVSSTDYILGCVRFACKDNNDLQYRLMDPTYPLRLIPHGSYRPELVLGFFQAFVYQTRITFGRRTDRTFSGCDLWLASRFAFNQWVHSEQFHVLHLGRTKVNWHGRVSDLWC